MANAKAEWSSGYITEVPYTVGYYRELAPLYLNYCASQRGYRSPDALKPFVALELGCGYGLSANLIAAANPHGKFYAVDFNPAHIVWAREMAAENPAQNITFLEESFADMDLDALPQFDYITLHGVFSWVTPGLRQNIIDIFARKLKPGGLVYVSYNCLPGWSPMAPVRKLMYELAKASPGTVGDKLPATIQTVKKLIDSKFAYFNQIPFLATRVEQLAKHEQNYLLHEYFNDAWELMYFADVVKEVERAKLEFVSSAFANDNIEAIAWPGDTAKAIEPGTNPIVRETLRDFALSQQFRRDIFTRGASKFAPSQHQEYLLHVPFYLIKARHLCELKVKVISGDVKLEDKYYVPVLDLLATGPKTFNQIAAELGAQGITPGNVIQALNVLMAVNYAAPGRAFDPKDSSVRDIRKFNKHLLARAAQGREVMALAAPAMGGGHPVPFLDQLFILARATPKVDSIEFVLKVLATLGRSLTNEGKEITDPAEARERITKASNEFQKIAVPIYLALGIID